VDVDVDVEDKEDIQVAAVVMLVEQHRIVIKERWIQTVMKRLKVVEMEIGVLAWTRFWLRGISTSSLTARGTDIVCLVCI
jgi:hypothetical protein